MLHRAEGIHDLTKNDLTELKAFTNPPALVKVVLEGVCILLREEQDWATAKKLLANPQLMLALMEFDASGVTAGMRRRLKPLLRGLTLHKVQSVSVAAGGLFSWVSAMAAQPRVNADNADASEMIRMAEEQLAVQEQGQGEEQEQGQEQERVTSA